MLDLPDGAHAAWIARNVTDPDERAALLRLLAAADETDRGFLDTPVGEHAGKLAGDSVLAESLVGQRIGAFRLVRLLGKGGMARGVPRRARRRRFPSGRRDQAAAARLYSADRAAPVPRERQRAGELNHANIARLIEGGVTDAGVPYIAHGVRRRRADHALRDATRALDLRARLALFLTVCRAVEAAHRALIVHRDLKPSNMLVAHDGTREAARLRHRQAARRDRRRGDADAARGVHARLRRAGADSRRGAITTATDVYALGVLLSELVTGARRGSGDTRTPSATISDDTDPATLPAPLRSVRRQLRGDLDNIVLKATRARTRAALRIGRRARRRHRAPSRRPTGRRASAFALVSRAQVRRAPQGRRATTAAFLLAILAALGIALWQAQRRAAAGPRRARAGRARGRDAAVPGRRVRPGRARRRISASRSRPSSCSIRASSNSRPARDLEAGTRLDLTVLIAHLVLGSGRRRARRASLLEAARRASAADDARVSTTRSARAR